MNGCAPGGRVGRRPRCAARCRRGQWAQARTPARRGGGSVADARGTGRQDTTGCSRITSPNYALGCVISIGTTQRSKSSAVTQPELERRLAQRDALLVRVLGDLGGVVVADVRVERGDQHQRVVRGARSMRARSGSMPRAQCSLNARHASASRRDRLEHVVDHHRLVDVQLEVALRAAERRPRRRCRTPGRTTIVSASHCVGLTLPGMIERPGSFSGIVDLADARSAGPRRASARRWRSSSARRPASAARR